MAVSRKVSINRPKRPKPRSIQQGIAPIVRSGIAAAIGGPAGPAPAPAAPAAPATTPSPWNALYESRIAQANDSVTKAEPVIQRQESDIAASYGYGHDAAGNVIEDASNPFSQAAALKQSFQNRTRGTSASMAARGQLYAGSLQNKQNANSQDFLRSQDTLKRSYDSAWQALQDKRNQVKQGANDQIWQAQHDNLYDNLNSTPQDTGTTTTDVTDPWTALQAKYGGGRWDSKTNADGSRFYRGTNSKLYKIFPDGRRVAQP